MRHAPASRPTSSRASPPPPPARTPEQTHTAASHAAAVARRRRRARQPQHRSVEQLSVRSCQMSGGCRRRRHRRGAPCWRRPR
eukprot:125475-Chlamydomonas_euryale.AAC.1